MVNISPGFQKPNISSNSNTPLHSSVSKAIKSPGISNVLDGLGLDPKNISKIVSAKGQLIENPMQGIESMAMINVGADHSQVLAGMGLGGIEAALIINAETDIKKIKKSLREIKKSTLNQKEISTLLKTLGLTGSLSNLVFSDGRGGLVILQSAIEEIESLLEKEDSEDEENEEEKDEA